MYHKANEPIYITKNGYGDMVIMSMEIYEKMLKRMEVYQNIELSERQIKEGLVKDARNSLTEVREKYGI